MAKRKFWERETVQGLLMIAPNTLGLLLFYILPILFSIMLSLFQWDGLSIPRWYGLGNFIAMLNDPHFLSALRNTVIYTFTVVPAIVVLAVLFGVLLSREESRILPYVRVLYMLPIVTMPAAAALIWKWMLNRDFGLINAALGVIGVKPVAWLSSPDFILLSVVFIGIWLGFAFNIIIVISGLKGIPQSYYEAARIDGATRMQQFFSVTLPLLTPTLFFIIVTQLIACFQVFETALIVLGSGSTSGSLGKAAGTLVLSIYETGFVFFKMGYSSAQAFILFLIILGVTIIQFRGQKKWVHYV